jgi:hypothetical protein
MRNNSMAAGAGMLGHIIRNNWESVAEHPVEFVFELHRALRWQLGEILRKRAFLTSSVACDSLVNIFGTERSKTERFVASFLSENRGYLKTTTLNGEIGYQWI